MLQPQSDAEVQEVVEALRRLVDPCLDIQWNVKSICTKPARFSVTGFSVHAAEYDGRWEIIRREPSQLSTRDYVLVTRVCELDAASGKQGIPVMVDKGPYAPVGFWLVSYMQLWDRAQSRLADEMMGKLWLEHDRAGLVDAVHEAAAHREALEKVYRKYGGLYWMGGAQGKANAAPWLKDTRALRAMERQATPL